MAVPLFLEFSGKTECRATFQFSRLFTRAGTNGKKNLGSLQKKRNDSSFDFELLEDVCLGFRIVRSMCTIQAGSLKMNTALE